MLKHRITKLVVLLLLILVSNLFIFKYANLKDKDIILSYNIISDEYDVFQVFYSDGSNWTEENSQNVNYINIDEEQNLEFNLPINTEKIRFDLGNHVSNITISDIKLSYYGKSIHLNNNSLSNVMNLNQIDEVNTEKNKLLISTSGTDAFIIYDINDMEITNLLNHKDNVNHALKLVLCMIIDALIYMIIRKSRSVLVLVQDLYNSRMLIWSLAKNDFRTKYSGSYLGITWAFIQPVVTILVYWFVFEFGLKAGSPTEGVPFILWFSAGLVPWFFFSDAINNAMNCFVEYNYLVKKVVFKISILPIVKIISSFFVHLAFIIFIVILSCLYGFYPSHYMIQLTYYAFCTVFIILALSYITSAVVLFFKDLGQIINILLQICMWATPIMWSYTIVPEKYQWIIKINPMYYIVEGYRDTFINRIWFFEKYYQTIYFWIISLGIFGLGALIFKKLKPHFADVL